MLKLKPLKCVTTVMWYWFALYHPQFSSWGRKTWKRP